jgi:hypothetical protein
MERAVDSFLSLNANPAIGNRAHRAAAGFAFAARISLVCAYGVTSMSHATAIKLQEESEAPARYAPMSFADFTALLKQNGYSDIGYHLANQDLIAKIKDPSQLTAHFCNEGIPAICHFRIATGPPGLLDRLRALHEAPIADRAYKMALIATFARAWWNETSWHDPGVTASTHREHANVFSDEEIAIMMACREFGAIPFFSFGDSQARIYQHIRVTPNGQNWLLPISFTCGGSAARELKHADTMFSPDAIHKFNKLITDFFARLWPYLDQGTKCFFKFGQTDVDYLYFYKWQQEEADTFDEKAFHAFTDESLERYMYFLTHLLPPERRENVYICSVMTPVLQDEYWREFYIQAMIQKRYVLEEEVEEVGGRLARMHIPDIYVRTELNVRWNRNLKKLAEDNGFKFIDDVSMFFNEEGTKIDELYYRKSGGRDVHIDHSEAALTKITALISEIVG